MILVPPITPRHSILLIPAPLPRLGLPIRTPTMARLLAVVGVVTEMEALVDVAAFMGMTRPAITNLATMNPATTSRKPPP